MRPKEPKKRLSEGNLFKFLFLLVLVAIMVTVVILLWPRLREIAEPDGMQRLIDQIKGSGPWGLLVLYGIQIIQVMLGFVPSEIIAIVSGMIYGPWLGTLIVIAGCATGTTIVFLIVRKLGAPFVRSMVPKRYMEKINRYEQSDNFYFLVFILFLIPGIPKDVVTYIVPLSSIRLGPFVGVATLGRLPEMFAVAYAASDIAAGQYMRAIVIFAITAVAAIIGLVIYKKTVDKKRDEKHDGEPDDGGASKREK